MGSANYITNHLFCPKLCHIFPAGVIYTLFSGIFWIETKCERETYCGGNLEYHNRGTKVSAVCSG